VRLLVLWNAARGVEPGADAGWARDQTDQLRRCDGIVALELHPVLSAAVRHPRPCSWCLELWLETGRSPRDVVANGTFAEFLADLRLLGMHPSVLAIEGDR
jgi:hypothetical protein